MNTLDYESLVKANKNAKRRAAFITVFTVINSLTLVIGLLMLLNVLTNDYGYARLAQALFSMILGSAQLLFGAILVALSPGRSWIAFTSFALHATNLLLALNLPHSGGC
jgi:hypothetical protein